MKTVGLEPLVGHTPAPWAIGAGYGRNGVCVDAKSGAAICGVIGVTRQASDPDGSNVRTVDDPERWANARLIAAAPALLEVARAAAAYYEHYMQDEADDVEACVCGREQHERAAALRDALRALKPNEPVQRPSAEGREVALQRLVGQDGG